MNKLLLYFKEDYIELWSLDNNGRLLPVMYDSSNEIQLYFLLSGDEILMNNYAKQAYLNGNINSYGDFWKNIGNNSVTYERFATKNSFASLLPFVLKESVLPLVIKSHFHSNNLSDFLKSPNTLLVFDSFVEVEHREIILKLFFEIIGFEPNSISSIDYFDCFRELQIKRKVLSQTDSFMLTNISGGNFYFHLIGKNSPLHLAKKVLEGKGQDPQLNTVLEFLVEIAHAKGSFLKSSEIKKEIISDAKIILNKLSDGLVIHTIKNNNIGINPLKISFHRNDIEGRLNNRQSLNFIQNEFDVFRRQNNAEQLPLFLSGSVINQLAYREFFKTTYSNVYFEDEDFSHKLILACLRKDKSQYFSNYKTISTNAAGNVSPLSQTVSKPPPPSLGNTNGYVPPKPPPPPPPIKVNGNKILETNANSKPKPPPPPIRVNGNNSSETKVISKPPPPPSVSSVKKKI